MNTQRVIFIDQDSEFWPSGWMVWACAMLGAADLSLISLVIVLAVRH
jgi:hypothetical protein